VSKGGAYRAIDAGCWITVAERIFDGFDSQCPDATAVRGLTIEKTAGTRTMFILTGLVWVAFGVVLFARPDIGAVTLALLFGLFSLISGVTLIARGVQIRRTGKSLRSVLPKAA
jgi:Short repeat of unknown function (DUF308)